MFIVSSLPLAAGRLWTAAGLAGLVVSLLYMQRRRRAAHQQQQQRLPPSIPRAALPLRLRLLYPLLGDGPLLATPLLLHQLARTYGQWRGRGNLHALKHHNTPLFPTPTPHPR